MNLSISYLYFSIGERPTCDKKQDLSQIKATKSSSITVKDKSLNWLTQVSGIAVTNNGTVLLTFYNNKNIKSVSAESEVLSFLSLPYRPRNIMVLNATTGVAAAMPQRLYIIAITDHTTLSRYDEVKLQYNISAVTNYRGNLVISCDTNPATTKMINMKGRELWSISENERERQLFSYPDGIATTTIHKTDVIVVTDCEENTLTLIEAEKGKFIRVIDVEEKAPLHITVDKDGHAYVCYRDTNEISVWSNDFKESKILLNEDDLGKEPCCILYSPVDESLYISYLSPHKRNTVDRFRLF